MFFNFRQNNSGGSFCEPAINVIIEARDYDEANYLAQRDEIGLYFNGCYIGYDCECCGDRWSSCDSSDGTEEPEVYSTKISELLNKKDSFSSYYESKEVPYIKVFYKDGTIKTYNTEGQERE